MRLSIEDLMQKLAVPHVLSAYETFPWASSDPDTGKTCSAEVRMNPDGDEVEAELQMVYETPIEGRPSVEQVIYMKALPHQDKWAVEILRIKGENWINKIYAWEEKACNLFRACIVEIENGYIPDMDELIEREMNEKERFGDQRGGGAGKAPKIRPGQLLGMKKGAGF
jgi:hypothetical protein